MICKCNNEYNFNSNSISKVTFTSKILFLHALSNGYQVRPEAKAKHV